jgi:hypothetical protein
VSEARAGAASARQPPRSAAASAHWWPSQPPITQASIQPPNRPTANHPTAGQYDPDEAYIRPDTRTTDFGRGPERNLFEEERPDAEEVRCRPGNALPPHAPCIPKLTAPRHASSMLLIAAAADPLAS